MALLVLLAAPARARVVAPDLVVDDALLHGHRRRRLVVAAAPAAAGRHVGRRRVGDAVRHGYSPAAMAAPVNDVSLARSSPLA